MKYCLLIFTLTSLSHPLWAAEAVTANSPVVVQTTSSDLFQPGWSGKYKRGIGYSTSLLSTSTFIYDHYTDTPASYSGFFSYTNAADSSTQSIANNGTTIVTTNSGSRSLGIITLAGSYNYRLFRNEWSNIRIGFLGGINLYPKTSYDIGTQTTTIATGVVTYSGFGTSTLTRPVQIIVGPILMTAVNLRWFPMLSIGMDSGIFLFSNSKTTTESSSNTAGVVTKTTQVVSPGIVGSTRGDGTFGFSTSFAVRYVW